MNAVNKTELFQTAIRVINHLVKNLEDSPNSRATAVIYQVGVASGFALGRGWDIPNWFTVQGFEAAHSGIPMVWFHGTE